MSTGSKQNTSRGATATIFILLLALVNFTNLSTAGAAKRSKEIGIRKVMGGSVQGIVVLLSKDFSKLILLAFVIACPLAWYVINGWLNNFAFHVEINWVVFILVGMVTLLIALLTISYRALQAAYANPVKSLKRE